MSCQRKCKSLNIVSDGSNVPKCGDGKCDSNENNAQCSQDCSKTCETNQILVDGVCKDIETCSWYQEPYTKEEKDYGFLGWRHIFGNPVVNTVSGCKTAGWLYGAIAGIVIMFFIVIFAIISLRPRTGVIQNPTKK